MSVKRHLLLLAPLMLVAPGAVAANYQGSLTTLYSFTGGADGGTPNAPLALDSFQDLFGTAQAGGVNCEQIGVHGGCGTLYELNAQGQFSVLHEFTGEADGGEPLAGPILLRGKLYGTALRGGAHDDGVIYALNPDGSDFQVVHSFTRIDGGNPQYPLLPGPAGGLYGISRQYGIINDPAKSDTGLGTVFLWEPPDTSFALHSFTGGADGGLPSALVEDTSGNLYGSTTEGGSCSYDPRHGCGVIFKIDRATRTFSVLYTFTGGADGTQPLLGSVGGNGTLYGASAQTTPSEGQGNLFTLTPNAGGYSFAQTSEVHTGYSQDFVTSGPQPAPDNIMAGTTYFSLYFTRAGHTETFTAPDEDEFAGPLTVTSTGDIYGSVVEPLLIGGPGSLYRFSVNGAGEH